MNEQHKIGIWLTHGIGDVTMTLPSLDLFIQGKSNIYYFFLKSKIEKDLICTFLETSKIIFVLMTNKKNFIKILFSNKFNEFYFVHGGTTIKHFIFYLLVFSRIKIVPGFRSTFVNIFFTKAIRPERDHKVNYYRKYFSFTPINVYPLIFSKKDVKRNRYVIVISPGCGEKEKHKRWSDKNWIQFIHSILLIKSNMSVILIGTKVEMPILVRIQKELSDNRISIYNPKSIKSTVNCLLSSDIVITVCNGTSHLASFLGIPVIALYGPTNPSYTGVFGNRNTIIRSQLNCSPCYRTGFIEGCRDPICMNLIPAKRVFDAFIEVACSGTYSPQEKWLQNKIVNKKRKFLKLNETILC